MTIPGFFKKEDWLIDVVYPAIVVLMQTLWIYPWLIWLGYLPMFAQPRPPVSLLSVFLILTGSFTLTRFFSRREWRLSVIKTAIIACSIAAVCITLRIEYGNGYPLFAGGWLRYIREVLSVTFTDTDIASVAIPVVILLWWQGILLERRASSMESTYRLFLIGIAAFIVLVAIWNLTFHGDHVEKLTSIGLYAIGFFCFGLLSLSVRNLYLKRQRITEQENKTSVWRSLSMMLVVIAAITIFGLIVTAIMSGEFFVSVGNIFSTIWNLISKGLYYVIWPLLYVASAVFWLIKWLLSLFPKGQPVTMEGFEGGIAGQIEITANRMPGVVTTVLQLLAAAGFLAFLIFILSKAIKRFWGEREDTVEEIHESILTLDLLRQDLNQFLKTVGRLFRRKQKPPVTSFDDNIENLTIRDIYKRLLWEGDRSGTARNTYETPAEYALRLGEALNDGDTELYEITELYCIARYGDNEIPAERSRRARSIWPNLRTLIRHIGDPEGSSNL